LSEDLERKRPLREISGNGMLTLKFIFKEQGMAMWTRIETSGRLL
jgi:hypothetical protein